MADRRSRRQGFVESDACCFPDLSFDLSSCCSSRTCHFSERVMPGSFVLVNAAHSPQNNPFLPSFPRPLWQWWLIYATMCQRFLWRPCCICVFNPYGSISKAWQSPFSSHVTQGDSKISTRYHRARKVIEKGFRLWKAAWGCGFRCSTASAHNPAAFCSFHVRWSFLFGIAFIWAWEQRYNPCPSGPWTLEDYLFQKEKETFLFTPSNSYDSSLA